MTDPMGLAEATADRIAEVERRGINATIAYDPETIHAQARAQQQRSTPLPLGGMAIGVKDNICTLEYPTTCASRILEHYQSPYEATAVTRLKAAGAIIACKTNLDEFGMGSSTEYSAFGRCRHPLDPDRVPGGSSGGSAALVATGAVDAALGSETGGSVRQPAAFCGVVGLKPSYGRVSRYGLVAFGSSLDQIGIFARSVSTAGRVFQVISGHDERDSTSVCAPDTTAPLERTDLNGLVIGLPAEFFPSDLDPHIRAACDKTLDAMRGAGATIRHVSLAHSTLSVPCYYVIAPAEASANLARFDGIRYGESTTASEIESLYCANRGEGFGEEVRRRIIVGTYVLSSGYYDAYYAKAQAARGSIAREIASVFEDGVDLMFTPTTPTPAFRAGECTNDPVAMYHADVFVCAANLAGIPAISIPIGRSGGLPLGGQFMAPAFGEPMLLDVAEMVEALVDAEAEA